MLGLRNILPTRFPQKVCANFKQYSTQVNYLKPADSRKTYLINRYKHITSNSEILLFAHHNNLLKSELNTIRGEIKKIGGDLTILRNSLFEVFLRNEHEAEPASVEAYQRNKYKKVPFAKLLTGPTCLISFQQTQPEQIKKLIKFLKVHDKMFLVGGRIENKLYDLLKINDFKELPSKEQLQSELVGLLTLSSGLSLVQTLEASSKVLYLTLDTHRKNVAGELEPEANPEAVPLEKTE